VIERRKWETEDKKYIPAHKILPLRVKYGEIDLGRLVRQAGGVWNRARKVWELRYDQIKALGLTERIIDK